MARWFYGRRRWYGRRNFGRRYRRFYGRRFGRGLNFAQKSGTRKFSLIIPVEQHISLPVTGGADSSYIMAVTPFYSTNLGSAEFMKWYSMGNLVDSDLFTMYTHLYDEVKINGVSVKGSFTGSTAGVTAGKIFSCVDRHANKNDFYHQYSPSDIVNGVEHQTFSFTSLDRATFFRVFNARDLQERTTFVDSSTKVIAEAASVNPVVGAQNVLTLEDWWVNGRGGFIPFMLFQFKLPAASGQAGDNLGIDLTVKWNVTFRNPKFQAVAAAKGAERSSEEVSEVKPVSVEGAGKSKIDEKKKIDEDELTDLLEKLKKLHLIDEDDDPGDELTNEMLDDKS